MAALVGSLAARCEAAGPVGVVLSIVVIAAVAESTAVEPGDSWSPAAAALATVTAASFDVDFATAIDSAATDFAAFAKWRYFVADSGQPPTWRVVVGRFG